ncbi:hypothetical protein RFF05_10655 [Bengtsoniella intestinalis]|uniref:hypothetical protein n=1 Tax=Bengtsoniella intestinalis TaxID=3073143 RepID=UPI00391F82E0
MTMEELSEEYAQSARIVYHRMRELRRKEMCSKSSEERGHLRRRILALQPLYRDAREISTITKHYYHTRSKANEPTTKD